MSQTDMEALAMGMKWFVKPVEMTHAMEEGTVGEPFAYDPENDMVYVKEQVFDESNEPKSSAKASDA